MIDLFIISLFMILLWTFWSGFTDASNSITTIVSTRVLKPISAVGLAAAGNLVGGVLLGDAVAKTMGAGVIDSEIVSAELIVGALIGGMIWDVFTYYRGYPISESQVLVGSLMGAGIAAAGLDVVHFESIISKIVIPMLSSPIIAFFFSIIFSSLLIRVFWKSLRNKVNMYFGRLQILSSFFFSLSHGANDAMKSAGILAALLSYYGLQEGFQVPIWIKLVTVGALSFGTLFGGWRIVKTMGFRLVKLDPWQGFSAETSAALVVGVASQAGFPLSTSQTVSGAIMGSGSMSPGKSIRWGVAREVIIAWLLTIPVSAIFSFIVYEFMLLL